MVDRYWSQGGSVTPRQLRLQRPLRRVWVRCRSTIARWPCLTLGYLSCMLSLPLMQRALQMALLPRRLSPRDQPRHCQHALAAAAGLRVRGDWRGLARAAGARARARQAGP